METLWLSTLEISDSLKVGPVNGHLFTLPKTVEATRSKHIPMSNITGEPTSFTRGPWESCSAMDTAGHWTQLLYDSILKMCLW